MEFRGFEVWVLLVIQTVDFFAQDLPVQGAVGFNRVLRISFLEVGVEDGVGQRMRLIITLIVFGRILLRYDSSFGVSAGVVPGLG